MKRKCLAVGIILLFLGVSVAPSINQSVVKASQNDNLIEVTTQPCGIKGYGDTTVKLTREQYQNLEQYLVDFRARLNETSTREEAVPIFKDAVVELDRYGLLPKGMSVKKAQQIVIGLYQDDNDGQPLKKIRNILQENSSDLIKNYFCLIVGRTNTTEYWNIIKWTIGLITGSISTIGDLFVAIYFILDLFSYFFPDVFPHLFQLLEIIFGSIGIFFYKIGIFLFDYLYSKYWEFLDWQPFLLGGNICFYGGVGWVFTNGLNGIQKINGTLYGQIPYLIKDIGIYSIAPQAIKHFVGLKIHDYINGDFFIGSALRVKIGLSPLYP
jgi:hypothetical protein